MVHFYQFGTVLHHLFLVQNGRALQECSRSTLATAAQEASAAAPLGSSPSSHTSSPISASFGQARPCHLITELVSPGFEERGTRDLRQDFTEWTTARKSWWRLEEPGDERDLHCMVKVTMDKDGSLPSGSSSERLAVLELITSTRPCPALSIYWSLLLLLLSLRIRLLLQDKMHRQDKTRHCASIINTDAGIRCDNYRTD